MHALDTEYDISPGAQTALDNAAAEFVQTKGDALDRLRSLKSATSKYVAGWVAAGLLRKRIAFDMLLDLASTRDLIEQLGEVTITTALTVALDEPSVDFKTPPSATALDQNQFSGEGDATEPWDAEPPPAGNYEPDPAAFTVPAASRPSLKVTNVSTLAGRTVKPRRWLVPGRIPMAKHTLLSGDGAAGKTTILLQLCQAVVCGTDWLGAVIDEPGPAIFFTAEEDDDEMHFRISAVNEHTRTDFAELKDFHFISLPGMDAVLAQPGKDGMVRPTALFDQLEKVCLEIRPKLIAIEAAADVFAGNENSRQEVRQFSQILRRLAIRADAAVVLVQHPSVSGLAEGSGRSGSTGWRNSFRSQLHFAGLRAGKDSDEGDSGDLRTLTVGKSNYAPQGGFVTVRYQRGVFVMDGAAPSLDRIAAEAEADALFLRLLQVAITQGRDLSPSKSPTYAPAVLEKMPGANGVKSRAFAAAMERLLASNKIKIEDHGTANRPRKHLAIN